MRHPLLATAAIPVLLLALGEPTPAQHSATTLMSRADTGKKGDSFSDQPSLSADGRFVAFRSTADNLVSGDTNGVDDIFVRDRMSRTTTRVSVDSAGQQADKGSIYPSISADGRYVVFRSSATNLVSGDNNGFDDVFVRDCVAGTTVRASVDSAGHEGNWDSYQGWISGDGRFVAFRSVSTNLVSGDTNNASDVFVRDLLNGTTERVSVDSSGAQANNGSYNAAISVDGRFVAFDSAAGNLVPNDTNGGGDVFVHDRQTGTTERVSVDSSGAQADGGSTVPSISADGRFVAFFSLSTNLVPNDTNGVDDSFVRDRQNGTTERVSVDASGGQCNGYSESPSISADGRWVAFSCVADNLVPGDVNRWQDAFLKDRSTGAIRIASVSSSGVQGDRNSGDATISPDGRFVGFDSIADNLVNNDKNSKTDVFVHGSYLTLEAEPGDPGAGATLTFSTWRGAALAACLLVVSDVNGTPTFVPEVSSTFDADGLWTLAATVPAGLSGNVVTFETFGIATNGKIEVTNAVAVAFQ